MYRITLNNVPCPKEPEAKFEIALGRTDWSEEITNGHTDSGCDLFLAKINELVASFIRRRNQYKRNGNTLPLLNDECKNLMKDRDGQLKKNA